MKKSAIIMVLMAIVAFGSNAQQYKEYKYDTLNGNETVNFEFSATGVYNSLTLDVDLTELGGTSDGTLILQARNVGGGSDGSWSTLTSTDFGNQISYLTNDTLTITDGAVWKVYIENPGFNRYRIQGAGTASDTTLVEIVAVFNK